MNKTDVTLDHIVPTSKGGTNEFNNFQVAHMRCNTRKGDTFP